jgi:hypothetical protein
MLSRPQVILFNRAHHRQYPGLHSSRQYRPSIVQRLEILIDYFIRASFARANCAGFCAALM